MARVYRRGAEEVRRRRRRLLISLLGIVLVSPLLLVGAVALLHLVGLNSPHPLVRLAVVEGNSMEPTFRPGEQLLFLRRPWRKGSVVLADIKEPNPVVKRVIDVRSGKVLITGDNQEVTATYLVEPDAIIATYCCRTGLKFRPPELPPSEPAR